MNKEQLKEMAKKSIILKDKYTRLYMEDNFEEAAKAEREYAETRISVLDLQTKKVNAMKSIPMKEVKRLVSLMPKKAKITTGIRELDYELVDDDERSRGVSGGFGTGNFIQITGSKGAGKSTLMMKMMTGFSNHEKVVWFDFEMGMKRVSNKVDKFAHDEDNLMYYSGDRDLEAVQDEIKLMAAAGVKHFVIDSAMKIIVKNVDKYDRFSTISSELSATTAALDINIYMINQMSKSDEKEGHLSIKHGNDAEYDADFMFFLLKKPLIENGKNVYDDIGLMVMDSEVRTLVCTKDRENERDQWSVDIKKSSLEGIKAVEVEYEGFDDISQNNVNMPAI